MTKPLALVTGAGGELGRLLVPALVERGLDVVALDVAALPATLRKTGVETAEIDILSAAGVAAVVRQHAPSYVFHLAAILSRHAERDWERAHRVNVEATLELYKTCKREVDGPVRFLFPSSIAVYGLPDAKVKLEQGAVKEWQWTTPAGIYGCNKLYCELVGCYLSQEHEREPALDFRAIRFPGLISAETLPSGGTTDFAPEMIHAAAQRKPYASFVAASTRLPFMTMPDAVAALVRLAEAAPGQLVHRVFNARGFSASAGEIRAAALGHFPEADIRFAPDPARQAVVDSWPADLDDSRARREWGFAPRHGLTEALADYLVPALERRYAATRS